MLQSFLASNRSTLIDRCRAKVATRRAPRPTPAELQYGIPLFLGQLIEMLGEVAVAEAPAGNERRATGASKHGEELLRHGFTIEQVVHDYGDLCQSITELAAQKDLQIPVQEFGLLNIELDNAIAAAVAEYARPRPGPSAPDEVPVTREALGGLAHEMRNHLNTTILAISAIKRGTVSFSGATGAALDRSLIGMRDLIDRTLAEVRLEEARPPSSELIDIATFILQVQVAASLEAAHKGCELSVAPVAPGIFVKGDAHMLAAAVANLLQNAFKFTRPHSHVMLRAHASDGRVFIDVEDECGGLPGNGEELFRPFKQSGSDRSGVGLGLTISRQAAEANGGTLSVANRPGVGCVFTIELPQASRTA
jgi:signal transduction histidine kinase